MAISDAQTKLDQLNFNRITHGSISKWWDNAEKPSRDADEYNKTPRLP